jgi:hypothetical protein
MIFVGIRIDALTNLNVMKKVVLIGLLLLSYKTLFGQEIFFSPLLEKTISGNELGAAITYRSKRSFAIGGFYQGSINPNPEELKVQNPFCGAAISMALLKCDRLNFHANTRIGFVNKNFLVVVPGVETEIHLFKTVGLGIGISIRKAFVAANTSIKIKI